MRALALATAAMCACADAPSAPADLVAHHARRVSGALGTPIAATPLLGLFTLDARVDGAPVTMLVDTGAPLTFVTPGASTPRGAFRIGALGLGAATLFDVPALGDDPFGLAPLIGGVLGVNVICQFVATWDWQRRRFTLGEPPSDADVLPESVERSFTLRGGGTLTHSGAEVAVPPTRIVLDAEVEGARRTLVLDTGASTSALRSELIDALATSRRSITLRVTSQGGVSTQRLVRARALNALGVRAEGVALVGFSGEALDAISSEVGARVDGLLGADILAPYLTTLAYPSGRIILRRYRDLAHVRDRWVRVGLLAGRSGGAWRVTQVFPQTSAERLGVPVGAVITRVAGVELRERSLDEVDAMLQGDAGETRAISTSAGEFSVAVEDLLPLP